MFYQTQASICLNHYLARWRTLPIRTMLTKTRPELLNLHLVRLTNNSSNLISLSLLNVHLIACKSNEKRTENQKIDFEHSMVSSSVRTFNQRSHLMCLVSVQNIAGNIQTKREKETIEELTAAERTFHLMAKGSGRAL